METASHIFREWLQLGFRLLKTILRPRHWIRNGFRRLALGSFRLMGAGTIRFGGPTGIYVAIENSETISVVLPQQESREALPDSLRVRCAWEQDKQQPWPIFWQKISHARLVGTSLAVLDTSKKMMVESIYNKDCVKVDPSYNYFYLPKATRLTGSWTSLISRWCPSGSHNYYHWLVDGLPRLALLDRFPADTGILVPTPLCEYERDSLEILGVLDRCRPTSEIHLEIESYYFSAPPMMSGCDNPYALRFLRDRFLSSAGSISDVSEKLYVSRLGSARAAPQEKEMIHFLQGEGWKIVQAEHHTFREQISLFSNARAVCGLHGAGLANLIWCPPRCKVLELCSASYLNGCYEGIAAHSGLDYRYLVFNADDHHRTNVDMKQFSAAISALGN